MLFLGWYVWLNDVITGSAQQDAAQEIQEQLRADFERDRGDATAEPEPEDPSEPRDPGEPVVGTAPPEGEAFGALIVPRFGEDYVRTIASGVDLRTGREDVRRLGLRRWRVAASGAGERDRQQRAGDDRSGDAGEQQHLAALDRRCRGLGRPRWVRRAGW